MIGLLLFENPITGEPTVSELFWWVEPEARGSGVRLLKRAEQWAVAAARSSCRWICADAGRGPALTSGSGTRMHGSGTRKRSRDPGVRWRAADPGVSGPGAAAAVRGCDGRGRGVSRDSDRGGPVAARVDHADLFGAWTPTLSFFRQSPAGQRSVRTTCTRTADMGDWTAILD